MINRTRCRTVGALLSIIFSLSLADAAAGAKPRGCKKQVKNVILLIADGTGVAHFTLSRWYDGGAPLAMDEWTCGLVRTFSANTPLTDSAPAASAFATGFKTFPVLSVFCREKASMWGRSIRQLHTDAGKPAAGHGAGSRQACTAKPRESSPPAKFPTPRRPLFPPTTSIATI